MSSQEILERAIQKAVDGGWEPFEFGTPTTIQSWQDKGAVEIAVVFPLHNDPVSWVRELEGIIFNHDFAKALWPGVKDHDIDVEYREYYGSLRLEVTIQLWQYHLQQMVIADDPIQYLGDHLDG